MAAVLCNNAAGCFLLADIRRLTRWRVHSVHPIACTTNGRQISETLTYFWFICIVSEISKLKSLANSVPAACMASSSIRNKNVAALASMVAVSPTCHSLRDSCAASNTHMDLLVYNSEFFGVAGPADKEYRNLMARTYGHQDISGNHQAPAPMVRATVL